MLSFPKLNTNNILVLTEIDSTNNLALRLIEEGVYSHSQIIRTLHQTAGRGQRDNKWESEAGQNLLFSIIIEHTDTDINDQFLLNMGICVAIYEMLSVELKLNQIKVKWPNDIYINEKKICGVLIENIIRGDKIHKSVVGIGLNINQEKFDKLEKATSLYAIAKQKYDIDKILNLLVNELNILMYIKADRLDIVTVYNQYLKDKGTSRKISYNGIQYDVIINKIDSWGKIYLETNEQHILVLSHGEFEWL